MKYNGSQRPFQCSHSVVCCQLHLYCQCLCLYKTFGAKCKFTTKPMAVAKIPICLRFKSYYEDLCQW